MTVGEHAARWLEHGRRRWAHSTHYGRERTYRRHLHDTFGERPLDSVTATSIEDWIEERRGAGVGDGAVRHAFQCLQALLGSAARKHIITWNPAGAVDLSERRRAARRDHLTVEEYRALLGSCTSQRERLWVRLGGEAALRRGEICALRLDRIDLAAGELTIDRGIVDEKGIGARETLPKGGRVRIVVIGASLADELRRYVDAERLVGDDRLFTAPGRWPSQAGGPLKPGYLTDQVRGLYVRAGLTDGSGAAAFTLHDLRRSAATFARERGVAVEIIRDQLGHVTDSMTRRHYLRTIRNARLVEFADAIDDVHGDAR